MQRKKSFDTDGACLYLVATPIGNLEELTPRAIKILQEVDAVAAEDTRNTVHLLSHFGIKTKLITHHEFNETESTQGIVDMLQDGKKIALVSDAGYPCISDPGAELVKQVSQAGFPVVPISGANAAMNALVASGITPQPFLFYGFLNAHDSQRNQQLEELKTYPFTIIFYESLHRIKKMLKSVLEVFGDRTICLARELTKLHEEFLRGHVSEIIEVCEDLRGEMVVVVEGLKEKPQPISMTMVEAKVNEYIQNGLSTSEAIKCVAKEYKLSKNEIYRHIHQA